MTITIDDAISRLEGMRGASKLGGETCLVLCLVGSELSDADVDDLSLVEDSDGVVVQVLVDHPEFPQPEPIEADQHYIEFFDAPDGPTKVLGPFDSVLVSANWIFAKVPGKTGGPYRIAELRHPDWFIAPELGAFGLVPEDVRGVPWRAFRTLLRAIL